MGRGKVRVGPPKIRPKIVAKVRRNKTQAYGAREEWERIKAAVKHRDQYRCRRCHSTTNLQIDHIIPVAAGGRTIMQNLWTLCDTCHAKRPGHRAARYLILHNRTKKR